MGPSAAPRSAGLGLESGSELALGDSEVEGSEAAGLGRMDL